MLRRWKIIVIGVWIISLFGCQGGPAVDETQLVVLWHSFTGVEAQALQTLTDRFNAQSTTNIVLVTEYQTDIPAKLAQSPPERQPDLVIVWPDSYDAYRAESTDLVGDNLPLAVSRSRADMLPMAEALFTVEGKLWALPLGLGTYLLYYNADWLSDLGYTPESATLEMVRTTACAATDPLRGQIGLGAPMQAGMLLALLSAGGAEIYGADGRYHFADAAGIGVGNALNTMVSGACALVAEDRDVLLERLGDSSMAIALESSLRLSAIENSVSEHRNFSLGVSAIPGIQGSGPTLWYGPGIAMIAPEGARRIAAAEVLGWFFSAEAQADWGAATHYLPTRRSLLDAQLQSTNLTATQETLLRLTRSAAESGTWVAWPRHTNLQACRGALLQTLLALGNTTLMPGVYIEQAATACNAGIQP